MKIPVPSVLDAHIYGGLIVAAVGGWQLSPPLTLVALGVVLMALGLFAPPARTPEA